METIYIGADSIEFKAYTDEHRAELRAVDGRFRWICKNEDGSEYIVRPLECKL